MRCKQCQGPVWKNTGFCKYHARSAQGVCVRCEAPVLATRRLCGACAERERQYARRRYYKRTAEGHCQCGRPQAEGSVLCEVCLERGRKTQRRRKTWQEQGLCRCGRPSAPGRKHCAACLERNRTRAAAAYAKRREQMKCVVCQTPLPPHKQKYCAVHAVAGPRIRMAQYQRIRYAARRARGECVRCGKPAVEGKRQCAEHLAYVARRQQRYYLETKGRQ